MNDMDKVVFRNILQKTIFLIVYEQKDVYQVVIDIQKTSLIMMLEKVWIQTLNLVVEELKNFSFRPK